MDAIEEGESLETKKEEAFQPPPRKPSREQAPFRAGRSKRQVCHVAALGSRAGDCVAKLKGGNPY